MSAKEMFEKAGYSERKDIKNNIGLIKSYYKNYDEIINFYEDKEVMKTGEYDGSYSNISLLELQAINKQVEELGWISKEGALKGE